ncbi:MAG TPA: outer membrane lipid asymmetry maintenance protein MlaD [Thermodesulfovibrionales bacterium]|nr:outer membrane lipid asymmetry maintenance protein MlaD [Thermodesulfovibrionales bacterium]
MKKLDLELAVGIFLLVGIFCLGYISVKLGRLELVGGERYVLYADFAKAGGIKPGSSVEIAGVEVGRVKSVVLDKDYQAHVGFEIAKWVEIQEDAIASVKTKGLIGEKYVEITAGSSEKFLADGAKMRQTESAIDIEELISKYAFGKV